MARPASSSPPEILPLHNAVYYLMRGAFRLLFRFGGLQVHGIENVPPEGAVIIAPNHASMFDPPLVGVATPRLVTTMAKSELFESKIIGLKILPWIIQRMGTFPVKRGSPDRRALRRAIQVLKDGGALVVFPEGTRTHDGELGPAEMGLAMIAHATGAPVVPVYLQGTERSLSKAEKGLRVIKPRVWFGPPLRFEHEYASRGDRATLQSIGDQVMRAIAAARSQASPAVSDASAKQ